MFVSCHKSVRPIPLRSMHLRDVFSIKALTTFVIGTLGLQVFFLGFLPDKGPTPNSRLASSSSTLHASITHDSDSFNSDSAQQNSNSSEARIAQDGQFQQVTNNSLQEVESPLSNEEETEQFITHLIQPGETLTRIWEQRGASYQGAIRAAEAFKRAGLSLSILQPGKELELAQDDFGEIVQLRQRISDGRTLLLTAQGEELFDHQIIEPEIVSKKRTVVGSIQHSLFVAASKDAVPHSVIDEFVDLFGGRVEFSRDLHSGDSFSLVYEERVTEDGYSLAPGPIESASLLNKGELLVAIRHVGSDGKNRYYDDKGNPLGNFFLRYPLNFTRISSMYSKNRFHPVLKRNRPHNGVDFAAPTGTPIRSVADGVVLVAGYHRGNGNWIKVRHSDRWETLYLHLSKIEAGVKKGTRVRRGQQIGRLGSTGLATGPHLHFELRDRGRSIDPLKASLPQMPTDGEAIPNDLLKVALQTLKSHHQDLQLAMSETGADELPRG